MPVAVTILVYVVAPLAVVALLAALTYLPGGRKRTRYKPGSPWEHDPVWYEPHPEHAATEDAGHGPTAIGSSVYQERPAITAGSDDGHGAPVGNRPVSAGPLGGARGTW